MIIWRRERYLLNSSGMFCWTTKGRDECLLRRPFATHWKIYRIFRQRNYGRQKLKNLNTTRKQSDKVLNGTLRHHSPNNKARTSKFRVKTMLIVFFDAKGVCIPEGQAVNGFFELEVLRRLK